MPPSHVADAERCYRAVQGRDRRFDGVFYTAVRTTGIYCRPSCPATTPRRPNVEFFVSAAAAQLAGYRACRRCLPDATPGSPEWDVRADVAGRAMRLINDGVVERDGVSGLARRIGYTPRHLGRVLTDEVGAGPLALARARRAQTARILVETTQLPMSDIAFASGFSSVRQFNATVAEVYACTPTELRGRRRHGGTPTPGRLDIRLAVRRPFDGGRLLAFLAARAVPGLEVVAGGTYSRTLALPHGPAVVHLTPREDVVACAPRGGRPPRRRCRRGALPPAAGPRRGPGRRRRPARGGPGAGPDRPGAPRPEGPRARRRSRGGGQSRGGTTDLGLRRPHHPGPPGRRARRRAGARRADPAGRAGRHVPRRRDDGGARPGLAADAPQPRARPGRPLRGHRRRAGAAGPQRAPRRGAGQVAGAAGDRPVDGRLHPAALARRPRRLPAHRRRRPARPDRGGRRSGCGRAGLDVPGGRGAPTR